MDTKTLSFSIALIAAGFAFLSVVIAVFRRERGLSIYAAAFVSAIASFLLFIFQKTLSPWIGVVLANCLLFFYQLSLAWALRTCLGLEAPWPRRFWLYAVAFLSALLAATFLFSSYALRAVLFSLFAIVCSFEFLFAFRRGSKEFPAVIRLLVEAVVWGFSLFHVVRIGLLSAVYGTGTDLMDNNFVSAYSFSFTIFFSVLWAGLVMIIDAAELMVELKRKNEKLEGLATTDELTGLSNRHLLDIKVKAEIERSIRYREPLSLIMFDIDHFKLVNDNWGHKAGDEVLKEMASVTREFIREPDNLFRWGGEEFLILAPHTNLSGAQVMAEKLRKVIEAHAFPEVGSVTASFGVSEWNTPMDKEQWFERVDHALYRAKNSGRNRVVCFNAQDRLPIALVKMEWRPAWESGNASIDSEHRRLLELSNNLLDLSLSRADAQAVRSQLDAVLEHTANHFANEERLLAEVGYPDLAVHERQHKELLEQSKELKERAERGECASGVFFDFLVGKVVIGHMLESDVLFFPYTRRQ